MKLSDFYFAEKHQKGTVMPIPLPNGKDSGEWLQVVGPDCDAAVRAGRAYTRAVYALKDSLSELDDQCKEKGVALNQGIHFSQKCQGGGAGVTCPSPGGTPQSMDS